MSQRKPAISTQLKQAQARITELEKEAKSAKQAQEWANSRASAAESELSDLHAFFDALPGAIPKESEQYGKSRTAMTRLAAWLATRNAA